VDGDCGIATKARKEALTGPRGRRRAQQYSWLKHAALIERVSRTQPDADNGIERILGYAPAALRAHILKVSGGRRKIYAAEED